MSEPARELEQQRSTILHLLMVAVTVVLIGVAGYFLLHDRTPLTRSQAMGVVAEALESEGTTTVSFHTGLVRPTPDENPRDPRYRLLVSLGILRVAPGNSVARVSLTANGRAILSQIRGVKNSADVNGAEAYVVPLATVQLDDISSITMSGRDRAVVDFTWRWNPNKLGEGFDASGLRETTFTSAERALLINKHGARYYHQVPTKANIALVRSELGWQLEN